VTYVAKQVAELRGVSVERIGELTSQNFDTLFRPGQS
jgi:Tat protein secretion system quality control protein TatD with DNase activity